MDGRVRCPACEGENLAAYRFCGECGTRLPRAWPPCQHDSPAGQRFCGECGARLTAVDAATELPSALQSATPTAYTPKHLAEKILKTRSAVEGERKLVTVMFSDVSGFTAMSERLDPEEVHAIMDRAFQVIIEAVHRYEGTINQFLGDGVMALFGAPIAHEDHPHRAIRAALAIQDGLSPLKKEVREAHGVKFRVRMGINTGLVFVGAIGKDLRMDYTAVGDTTNLGARLLGLAGPGQILVSAQTHRMTEGFFKFDELGAFKVKGKVEPIQVYAARSEIRGRSRLEVSRERGLTPLVGREQEIGRLVEAYRRASKGDGAIALLRGDPGVGKSRLLFEFLHRLEHGPEGTGVLELEATCLSYGASIPYHPILELVRRYVGLAEGLPGDEVRALVERRLESLGIEGDETVTLITHFLGISAPESFLLRFSAPQLKERTFDVLRAMLLRASETQPVILVVENVHWIDSSSDELLKHLAAGLAGHRLLLLLTSRLDHTVPWLSAPLAETIAVEGLDAAGVGRMTQALLGVERVATPVLDVLVDRGEGNPLYVEEILRQLRETGGIRVADGEAQLSRPDVTVPATIHDIIAARIDRLPDDVKHTLQVAAVVGRQVAIPLLARALEGDVDPTPQLAELQSSDFLFLSSREPELVYTFKHALTQDVAYSSLLERRRRTYHAAVGRGLEDLRAGRLDEVVELLAHHFGKSAEGEKAVDYAILAAEKAQRRWANTEALAQFEAALTRVGTMPDTQPNRLRRIDAVVKQAEIMFALGRYAEHVKALEAIRDLVEAAADPPRRAAWFYWTGFLHANTGHTKVALAYCRTAATIVDSSSLEELKPHVKLSLANAYLLLGALRDALVTGKEALAMFEDRGDVWWSARTLWNLSAMAMYLGDWPSSLQYSRRALEYGQALNDKRVKVVSWWRMGRTHIERGDNEAGVRCCQEALALSPSPVDAAMAKAAQGYGMVRLGQVEAGVAQLAETVAWFDQSNLSASSCSFGVLLADGYLLQGNRAQARVVLERILTTSREHGYRHLEGVAHRLLGQALAGEDPAAAARHLETALEILEDVAARNEFAKTLVAQAELCRALGDRVAARRLLERALAVFEALDTLDWPPRVREALVALAPRESHDSSAPAPTP